MRFALTQTNYDTDVLAIVPEQFKYRCKSWAYKDSWGETYITLHNLDELMEFIEACGYVVMTEDSIEIYNGYRE